MNKAIKLNIQKFAAYPVHTNVFKIGTAGRASAAPGDMVVIKDIETFEPAIDGNVEEWTPMDTEGWIRRMKTGNSLTITLSGKRNEGDPGNDYVAEAAFGMGSSVESIFEWTLPNGMIISLPCIVNTTTFGGGDSTNVAALEVEIMSDGKPTITPAA